MIRFPSNSERKFNAGDTSLTPPDPEALDTDELLRQPHLNLRVEADARADVGKIVQDSPAAQDAVAALYGVAELLLKSASSELMMVALQKIFSLVPAAQRISLVAWPPLPGQGFTHLAPPQLHPVWGKDGPAISRSLTRRAVESRRALLFSHATDDAHLGDTASIVVQQIRSAVYVPLIGDNDEVLGVLCVDTPQPWVPFEVRDFHFIRAVAALLTASLEADRLRGEARRSEVEAREMTARREAMAAFLKIASHDLKGPLSVMQMAGYALQKGKGAPENRDALVDLIVGAGRRARSLVDTYLEVCAVDSGQKLKLRPADCDPHHMADEEILLLQQVVLDKRGPSFAFVNQIGCKEWRADVDKLRQIFANLLSNACKYSPRGGRVVLTSCEAGDRVLFSIADEGVGISAADHAKLFRQFQRVGDESLANGSGLGLWLVQALVHAHGGKIEVFSRPGDGSTFTFSLARLDEE